uniref:Replication factor C small subunit n=1 Tax=viral metagenome TaxID=1070528 RepID=A0A6C0BTN8_9ZZZZ
MQKLDIHTDIIQKLDYFLKESKIPNIIFHGLSGSGKKTIVFDFIDKIYDNNKEKIKEYVMCVNCSHGKGIKFIREDLKLFSKTNISFKNNNFKSIVLLNADCLTIDAQSALRRCIELFTHTTRFFLVVQNRFSLLKPILSRFCEIYIPEKKIEGFVNLHQYNLNTNSIYKSYRKKNITSFKKIVNDQYIYNINDIIILAENYYQKGYSTFDFIEHFETSKTNISDDKKYEIIIFFNKIKKEFRNEKQLLFMLFYFIYLRSDLDLENISFI